METALTAVPEIQALNVLWKTFLFKKFYIYCVSLLFGKRFQDWMFATYFILLRRGKCLEVMVCLRGSYEIQLYYVENNIFGVLYQIVSYC